MVMRTQLFQKGIKVTVVCPGPIETSTSAEAGSSGQARSSEVSTICMYCILKNLVLMLFVTKYIRNICKYIYLM